VSHYVDKVTYTGKGKKRKKVTRKVPVYETVYVENLVRGTETFIWTASENSHKEQMVIGEFTSEGEEGIEVPEDDPAINALKLLYTKKYFVNSLRLAELVQKELSTSGRPNRGVKQRNDVGIWVLHATGMPSILVETGFVSNQAEIVSNITAALKQYITQDSKSPITTGNPR
jgi:N-acetylmuramoyl-L-alanine amidase